MNKIYLLLIFCVTFIFVNAQNIKEIGFSTGSLESFGFSYKFGTLDRVWNIKAINASGNIYQTLFTESSNQQKQTRNNIYLTINREFRKQLNPKFEFYKGIGLNFAYNNSRNDTRNESGIFVIESVAKSNAYSLGFNFNIGGNILLKRNLVLSLDVSPFIDYTVDIRKNIVKTLNQYDGINDIDESKTIDGSFRYGMALNNILFTLAYRITQEN